MKAICLSLIFLSISSCNKVKYSNEPLEHYAYIWNRVSTESLTKNLIESSSFLKGFSFLALEVSWQNNKPKMTYIEPPKENLKIHSLSFRVNDFSGDISGMKVELLEIFSKTLERFKSAGFTIDEIQIDFDCPSAKLPKYALLLAHLKAHFKEKLTITALPTWLSKNSFQDVIKSCDEFVLQLHSLTLPESIQQIHPLFVADDALKSIAQAAKLGKAFSISLPTYGYFLGFDQQGKYLGVSSEQGPKNWPVTKVLLTDLVELEKFMKKIKETHPELLKAVYWFRLHQENDVLNFNSVTMKELIESQKISSGNYEIRYQNSEKGVVDVVLANLSNNPIIIPDRLTLNFKEKIKYVDALGNFSVSFTSPQEIEVEASRITVLAPQKSLPICWFTYEVGNIK